MNIGFYYHIPLHSSKEGLKIPAYLGVFIDSLATEVETLTLFMHEANDLEAGNCDYTLQAGNICYYTLGLKSPAWDRFLSPCRTLDNIKTNLNKCDLILIRAPSPLAPAFFTEFHKKIKIAYLVVGDYIDGAENLNQPWWRKWPIVFLSKRNDRQLTIALSQSITLVNSTALYNRYEQIVPVLHTVKTTTLLKDDFFERKDTCQGNEIKILFTGGLSVAKGLKELVDASAVIMKKFENVSLHFVGGEISPANPVQKLLTERAKHLNIGHKIYFHGYRTTGKNLNEMYRMADIYAIPSYHEGFPRTIWEAMANSMPVVATKVGSIPHFLKDGEDALLIEPKNVGELTNALATLIQNSQLRQKLIFNGFSLAKENRLEIQTKLMVDILQKI